MRFTESPLAGAFVVSPELIHDERGFFSRTYCDDEFAKAGLNTKWPQENLSYNTVKHTLRGMHFNRPPYAEEKTVECTAGAVYDVIIDLRSGSDTQFEWFGTELTAANRTAMFVPRDFAHGFVTLVPNTEIRYRMGRRYEPDAASGIRWNDPLVRIDWPVTPVVINERDASYADVTGRPEEFS